MMNILATYNVSRETIEKLKNYEALVLEWNGYFNLISKSSVDCIWERHILDSVQLYEFIEKDCLILYDFGSGAGFPAIVLAIIAKEKNPNLKITLIESIKKKANFLNEVKNKLDLNIEIINDRIENIERKNVDIITSRAMASLDKLLEYAKPFCSKKTQLIFPKGIKWKDELNEAEKKWTFNYNVINSKTDDTGRILQISNLRRK